MTMAPEIFANERHRHVVASTDLVSSVEEMRNLKLYEAYYWPVCIIIYKL